MSGFDPSRFLEPELPLGGGAAAPEPSVRAEPEPVLSPPVAGVARPRRLDDGTLIDEETGEILDFCAAPSGAVAGVAATHDLPLTAPFARELNAMFSYPPPAYLHPRRWRQLCEDARKFSEAKAQPALEAGWEPLELFGIARETWKRAHGIRPIGTDGIVSLLRGRGVGYVAAHRIEILNRTGAHNNAYRAHFFGQRLKVAMLWEAFHPSNVGPPDPVRLLDGRIVSLADHHREVFGTRKV